MNVLSLFDGMSCGRIALERAGIEVDNYFSSEIDEYAIEVANDNWPMDQQNRLGDITKIDGYKLPKIDLLIGGSPCQGFSFAGKQLNFDDARSKLFFEYVRLLNEIKPKYFLLENVRMKKESQDVISKYLGVEPILINSNLVSIQNRERLYWTNIPGLMQPLDKKLFLKDYFDNEYEESLVLKGKGLNKLNRDRNRAIDILSEKTPTIMKSQEKKPTDAIVFKQDGIYRYPTRNECEMMQTVTPGYTKKANYRNATGMLGNGWTVDVIAHIFKGLKQ